MQVNAALMVKKLPPRLRELLKLRGGPSSLLAGPSSRSLAKTVTAVAAGTEAEAKAETRSALFRSRTEDGSRLKSLPEDIKQPLLEHPEGPDSPRSL